MRPKTQIKEPLSTQNNFGTNYASHMKAKLLKIKNQKKKKSYKLPDNKDTVLSKEQK